MPLASSMSDTSQEQPKVSAIQVCEHPIFVVGAPRSGTSMMQWALRQHPRLWGGPESDFLVGLHSKLLEAHEAGSRRGKRHWLSGLAVSPEEFLRHVGYGINALYTNRSGGRRWVEQTPSYTLHMPSMLQLFPGASFLMMIRDGRQVVHSLRHFVNPMPHGEACATWKEYVEAGLIIRRSSAADRVMPIRYESVVEKPEETLAAVYSFIGEDYAQESADFVRRPPMNSSFPGKEAMDTLTPRWTEWTPDDKRVFCDIAGELLVALGYEPDASWAS